MLRFKTSILLILVLFLSGCSSTLQVHNAKIDQVTPLVKDYVGINGFQITYQNEDTKVYRLSLGTTYIPHTSQIIQTTRGNQQLDRTVQSLTNLDSYVQTTVETVSQPAHYVEATARVRLVPKDNDVMIYIDTDGPIGTSLDDLKDFIEQSGYRVEIK